jgi:flagellar M-ring protein FliF
MAVNNAGLQIRNLLASLSPAKKISLAVMIIGTIAGFVLLMTWTGKPDFRNLYANLAPEDAGEILNYLKEQNIPYRVTENGAGIEVPRDRVHECRMSLASKGLPQGGGIGFEVFDNTKLGMTEFVQNVNYQRALQGELSRTINRIAEVESSRVHIVMPTKSLFIEQEELATASVVLKLRRGKWLTGDQVQSVVHLVSSSVARLKPENVTVVDTSGKLLAGFSDRSETTRLSSDQLEYQESLERSLEERIKSMLEKALGRDTAIVRLSAALDFKRQEMTEERFYPDNRVIRSEQMLQEKSGEPAAIPAGIPGVRSNIAKNASGTGSGNAEFEKNDRTVNYEIGKLTSHTIEPVARLKRVSVAVIVDGTYRQPEKPATGREATYIPRTAEEMAQLEKIVKGAINFDADRGDTVEVVNIPFQTEKVADLPEDNTPPTWAERLQPYAGTLKYTLLGIFLLFSFMFVVRPITKWLTSGSTGDVELLQQLPKTVGEIEREFGGATAAMPYRDEINRLLTTEGDISTDVMRDWMKES